MCGPDLGVVRLVHDAIRRRDSRVFLSFIFPTNNAVYLQVLFGARLRLCGNRILGGINFHS